KPRCVIFPFFFVNASEEKSGAPQRNLKPVKTFLAFRLFFEPLSDKKKGTFVPFFMYEFYSEISVSAISCTKYSS
ncbi:MAG TPA: hypothetical protein DHV12_02520, partial [Thermotogae bacterium]|nr:hypothetical protein [Thermotogota bacterium]